MILHHNMARIVAEKMLYNWKNNIWKHNKISSNVFLATSQSSFPSPDGSFHDPDNGLLIAIEFKPPSETKRRILTGLGQTIAYLNKYSLSYFICPESVEGFQIAKFIKEIFDKWNSSKEDLKRVVGFMERNWHSTSTKKQKSYLG